MCKDCGSEPGLAVVDHSIDHGFTLEPDTDNECAECGQHLSRHPDKIAYLQQRQHDLILEEGHQVRFIFPTDEGIAAGERPFWYSVGRSVFGRPDLLLVGGLDPRIGFMIINEVARIDGEKSIQAGDMIEEVINLPLKVVPVTDLEAAKMNGALAMDPNASAFQVLWPDANNRYPDEPLYDNEHFPQPIYTI